MKAPPKTPPEFERFREFVRHVVNVPGATVKQQIESEKQARKQKKTKPSASRASRAKD